MATTMHHIYIAGPYTHPEPVANVNIAILLADELRSLGFCPFVPHLSAFWHLVRPHDYEYWLQYDFEWLRKCDALLRFPGESSGADREMVLARELGIPIFYSVGELVMASVQSVEIVNPVLSMSIEMPVVELSELVEDSGGYFSQEVDQQPDSTTETQRESDR